MDDLPRMIKFACRCGTVLEVPADRANSSLQCVRCGRLVDVPALSDLGHLAEDGTYTLDELQLRDEPERLEDLKRTFSPQRVDDYGQEYDLREPFRPDPDEEETLELADEGESAPPKYDPVTGELIRAVPLRNEPIKFDPSTIPMAQAVINYAGGDVHVGFQPVHIIGALFRFQNVFVMFIILVTHVFLQLITLTMSIGMLMVLPGFVFLWMALLAHYSNVVADIGVEGNDELPRPLRDLSWYDDIWQPFCAFAGALLLCYGPMIFVGKFPAQAAVAYAGTVLLLGSFAFPAIFLTLTTSGTILNLAPDRVLRVISSMGFGYFLAVALWCVAAVTYVVGIVGSMAMTALLMTGGATTRPSTVQLPWLGVPVLIGVPLLLMGIALMHGFCWYMGLQYRRHHEAFAWYLQRHHRSETPARAQGFGVRPAPARGAKAKAQAAKPAAVAAPRARRD